MEHMENLEQKENQEVQMYTSAEAAELLGVTRQTVTRYVRRGLLDAEYVGLKKAVRIAEETLIEFANRNGISINRKMK